MPLWGLLLVLRGSCTRGLQVDPHASVTWAEGTKLPDMYCHPVLLTSWAGMVPFREVLVTCPKAHRQQIRST